MAVSARKKEKECVSTKIYLGTCDWKRSEQDDSAAVPPNFRTVSDTSQSAEAISLVPDRRNIAAMDVLTIQHAASNCARG